jgi:cytochrome c oxidase assembly factor CtaG
VYLFLATLPCDVLSAYLTFCDDVVYAPYRGASSALHASALQDQQAAGALMWVFITFVYLVPAVVITVQILSPRGRRDPEHASAPNIWRPPNAVTDLFRSNLERLPLMIAAHGAAEP